MRLRVWSNRHWMQFFWWRRRGPRFWFCLWRDVDWCDEPIAMLGEGLDKPGIGCRVSEQLADSVDTVVQTVVEVDEGLVRPQLKAQLVAGHELSGALQQDDEHLAWLA